MSLCVTYKQLIQILKPLLDNKSVAWWHSGWGV